MKKNIILAVIIFILTFVSVGAEDFSYEDFIYTILPDGTVEISRYNGEEMEITIPVEIEGISVTSIGESAFSYNESLTQIVLPESVISIGDHAFTECTNLLTINIPDGLRFLGDLAFQGDVQLESINLPAELIHIGMNPFDRCDSLAEINMAAENNFYFVEDGVLFDKNNNILISYPSGKEETTYSIPDWVTEIAYAAFSENNYLKGITLPDKVEKINGNPFCGCIGLEAILISPFNQFFEFYHGTLFNTVDRELIAYLWASEEDSYTLPSGVRSIGQEAFYKHPELRTIKFSQSLTTIKDAAFAESGLREITIPNAVTEIAKNAFSNCADLESVNLPSNLTRIGDYAFYECEALKKITFPNSLNAIGEGAFYHCTGLSELIFPESLHFIGNYAFLECTGLKTIDFPENLYSIGGAAFHGIEGLSVTVFPGSLAEDWAIQNVIPFERKNVDYFPADNA